MKHLGSSALIFSPHPGDEVLVACRACGTGREWFFVTLSSDAPTVERYRTIDEAASHYDIWPEARLALESLTPEP